MDDRFRKNDCQAKCCKNLKAGILAVLFFFVVVGVVVLDRVFLLMFLFFLLQEAISSL